MMCLTLASSIMLTACSDDDLVTDQYQDGVALNVWGPSPVVRGGELRFLGSNLDQIAEVIIPGVSPITNIEVVKAGVPSEIRVTVPKDGPEVGKIQLKTKTDQIIESITELTYTEDIVFESFSPAAVMPGEVVTIKGDYLNLIHMVEFPDGVQISEKDFASHSRYEIKVAVPETAKTGKIALYDADLTQGTDEEDVSYNIIMSDKALEIGTPTVAKIKGRSEVAAGQKIVSKLGETITISGADFNLVQSISVGGVVTAEITISKDGKTISFVQTPEMPDGDINLICKSGVEIPAGILETVAPSNLSVAPAPVKNGATLTIKGEDLDVVTTVTFPNADALEAKAANGAIAVVVPETAQEGDITLTMANGKTVTVAYTLVKPVVTSYSANPAPAGGELVLNGTNLDLVASVAFGASVQKEINATVNTITLNVPLDAESGKPVLNLKNGTTIECPELAVSKPEFCFIPDPTILTENELKAGDLLVVDAENLDVLTDVLIDNEATKYVDNAGKLYIAITANAGKKSTLTLISSNGSVKYDLSVVPNTEKHTVIWSGSMKFMDWNGMQDLAYGGYDWSLVTPGTEMIIHATVVDPTVGWGCVSVRHGNGWSNVAGLPGQYDFAMDPADITIVVNMTDEVLNDLKTNDGMIIMGHNFILSSIELVEHISVETTVWQGNGVCDDWGNQPIWFADGGADLIEQGLKVGTIVRFYISPMETNWNLQIVEGHWGGNYCDLNQDNYDLAANGGAIVLTVDEDMYSKITTSQGWGGSFIGNGDNVVVTKITIE